jgi:hypothetical protein
MPQYWPKNVRYFRTVTITCAVIGVAYSISQQSQHLYVPDGMSLVIKAHNFNNVASLILVATNAAESISPQSAYPLGAGEAISYQIMDAYEVWVSSNFAGSIVILSVEQ